MNYYGTDELRTLFLDFFSSKNHSIIPNASLVPETDHSVLYTTAGMHPLLPCLSGDYMHPAGNRLVNVQRVVRTGAIELVGSDAYFTFFELLGNWSLGDYTKEETIMTSWEFLTGKDYLDISPSQLCVTYFAGNKDISKDFESYDIWKKIKMKEEQIYALESNWKGPYGSKGICGPNTKVFYDTGKEKCCEACNPSCNCGKYIELWDIVFLDYRKNENGYFESEQKNVDTGMGLERVAALVQGVNTVYETDLFARIISFIKKKIHDKNIDSERNVRIIADHIRCAVFILGDENSTTPSGNGRGYVLRKVIRRVVQKCDIINLSESDIIEIAVAVIGIYQNTYPILKQNENIIRLEFENEIKKYRITLNSALKKFESYVLNKTEIEERELIHIYQTYGLPVEYALDYSQKIGLRVLKEQ